MADPLRIAFVKFGGLAAGGTERWLQMMAANLDRDRFAVDYFYCDAAPYVGSNFKHPDTDPSRLEYMVRAGVNLVKFKVGAKDLTTPTHDWLDTDFWELFDARGYDIVQTAKAGPAEYPYDRIGLPFVEYVTLSAGVDRSRNLALSIHLSQWQRREWANGGGRLDRSAVIPIPAQPPSTSADLRDELGIPSDDRVAGFHQRAQDEIFSPIPLEAFAAVARPGLRFVIMGGSWLYRQQAADLGLEDVSFVEHHGGAERISQFLNTLDVFAHGRADGETFGTVLAEALMHGLPCLSHRSPIANAQPETMGPAGLFAVDTGDYATKLERLLTDPRAHARLASKARPHAEQYYSLGGCVKRLEDAYDQVARRPSRGSSAPMAYGQSELGFLVAGDVDNPASIAHHVVAGEPPDEPVVDLLRHVLVPGGSYCEAGPADTVLPLAAAAQGTPSKLYTPPGADADAVVASIDLNNWEQPAGVEPAAGPADVPVDALRASTNVTVSSDKWAGDLVPRLLDGSPERPILLLKSAAGLPLGPAGYVCWSVGKRSLRRTSNSPGWVICLHPERHARTVAVLPAWTRRRRRATAERVLAAPGHVVRHVRPRAGALAYRVRRTLPF